MIVKLRSRLVNFHTSYVFVFFLFFSNYYNSQTVTETFTSSGNWICPNGITNISLDVYGAGGGGGGAFGGARVGAGGGGGGFTSLSGVGVTPSNSYAITVGSGGVGGSNAGTNGANGGTSNAFGLAASGGSGGGGMTTGTLPTGGVGGAGNGGSVFRNGGNGAAPTAPGGSAGGGGGCAGTTTTGSNGGVPTGGVGGGGLAGNGGNGSTLNGTPGLTGTTYGGGGGGGKSSSAGGNGASGVVVITYTLPPPTISGTSSICNGSSVTLTASGNAGTVSWFTVATGGTAIGTGNSITLSPTSTTTYYCEQTYLGVTSTRSNFTVTVNNAPSTPGPINGISTFCVFSSTSYSISPVTNATSYNWTIPSGSTIISGNGTNSVTVNFGANSGNISVSASNSCGSSSNSVLPVTNSTPIITGSNNICQGSSTTLTASGGANIWSSSSSSIASINSSSGFVIGNSPGVTTISCTSPAGCVSTFNLTVNQFPVLTSPTTLSICSGNTLNQTLTANPSAGTTFTWYSIGNSNVTGESTTSQSGSVLNNTLINTSTTAQNVLYTVNAISSLGCVGNQTVTVTVNLNPNFVTTPLSSTVCVGDSILISAKEEKMDAAQTSANQISWWLAGNNGWQSFTPSYSGKLLKVRLRTVTYGSGTTVTARIYSGVPATGTLLGSASVTKGANIDSWDDYIFPGSGISVTGGSNYYIQIPAGASADWPVSTSNPYSGGQAYFGVSSPTSYPSNDFSFETYIDPNTYTWNPGSLSGSSVYAKPNTLTTYTATGTNLSGCVNTNTVIIDVNTASVGGTANSNQTICTGSSPSPLSLTGNTGNVQWQQSSDNVSWSNISGATSTTISSAQMGTLSTTTYYRAASTNGVCGPAYSNTITVTVSPLSVGGTANGNQTICSGSTPSALSLTGNIGTIQWQSSPNNITWTNISGATSATLSPAQIGALSVTTYYRAQVTSGSCSSLNSTVVTITVNPATTISSQSTTSQTVCVGGSFSPISVTASGTGLTYQWYSNTTASTTGGIIIVGASSSSYTPPSSATGTTYYYAIINGSCGTATTAVSGALVVNSSTTISSQSTSSQTVCAGSSFSPISVTASGSGLTYQWYSNTTASTVGATAVSGATSASYTPPSSSVGTTYYYAIVHGTCGSDTSAVSGAMVVNPVTTITSQTTAGQTVCLNDSLNFISVSAVGTGLTYQWYSNFNATTSGGTALVGGNSSGYIPVSGSSGTTYYYAVVSGTCGSDTSSISGAMVVNPSTTISSQSTVTQTVCIGSSFSPLSINASGAGLTYQWYSNATASTTGGTLISGATGSSYTSPAATAGTTYYYAIVNGTCGTSTSAVSGAMVVNPGTSISTQSTSGQTACLNGPYNPLTVTATGTGLTYQWFSNSTASNTGGTAVSLAAMYEPNSTFCGSGPTTIIDVLNPTTGKYWMDRNLGATQAASSSTDINSYGDLYQWGRTSDGHQCRTSPSTTNLSSSDKPGNNLFIITTSAPFDWRNPQNSNLWQGVNGINNPCPTGYRLPTETEINDERLSWSNQNNIGAFNSPLKLPLAGGRSGNNGTIGNSGFSNQTWTSTINGTGARNIVFGTATANLQNSTRVQGYSVRCIKETSTGNSTSFIPPSNVVGTTYYYCVISGTCGSATSTVSGAITVNANTAITAQSTASQTVCIGSSFSPISVTVSGTGLTYQWFSNTTASVTGGNAIPGATSSIYTPPSSSVGTNYYYAIVNGTCGSDTSLLSGAMVVNPGTTITSQSTAGQTVCLNDSLNAISVSASGIGISYQWYSNTSASTIGGTMISGATNSNYTPPSSVAGTTYYYAIASGACGSDTSLISGAMVVNPLNNITLTSSPGTNAQTICFNTPITNITYSTASATGATFTGLPSGVSGTWAANNITISGTPSSSGTFNYTVTLIGGCSGNNTASGTIIVSPNNFFSLTSGTGSNNQNICLNANLNSITYSLSGATGVTFSGLPSGVSGSFTTNTVTISGSPTLAGSYIYTVTSTGGCGGTIATGTITVNNGPPVNAVVSSLNSGLVAWYPFSGNANDFSGNGLNGTATGVSLTADRFGNANKAYSFTGIPGNQISIAHNNALNSYPLTVSAWFKSGPTFDGGDIFTKYLNASWDGWECGLGSSGTSSGQLVPHYLRNASPCNGIIEGYSNCGNPVGMNYTGPMNDGNWHHVVFRVDSWGGKLYVDGQQVGQQAWIGTPGAVTTTTPLLIGPDFEGFIDDIGIWNRALSTDEIGYLFNTGTVSVCNGSSIAIAGSGANTYSWNTGATTQTITVSPTSATTYTVTGTNTLGCSSSSTFTVNVLPLTIPSVSVTPSTTAICLGDTVTFVATPINGGTTPTYQWKINGVNVTGATGSSFSSTSFNNNDVVTVQLNSNATPCLSGNPITSSPITISVNQPAVPSVSISSNTSIACQGSSVTFTATPSTGAVTPSYTWLLNGSPISGATSATYTTNSLSTGDSISVLINLNQGCFTSYSANSTQISTSISSGLNSLIGGSNNICFGESNGFIDATTSGGIAPYSYQWSNGATTEDQTGLTAGTYSVTITDAAGCVFNSSFLIYEPPAPLSVSNVVTNATCFGSSNGTIDLTCTGGYGQYQFFWSNGSNTEDQNQLSPGNYWVNVVDYNSCVFSDTLNISEPPPINSTISVIAVPCANDSTGSIDLSVTGGTGQYSFFWSNGFNGEDPSSLSSGSYQVTIIDANGCSDTTFTTLSSAASTSILTQNTPSQTICQGNTFSTIDVSATGGTITYQWYQNTIPSTFGGSIISGSNSSNFTPGSTVPGTTYYYCVASGSCGSDTSLISGAQVVDSLLTPSVSITASSLTVCNGLGIFFYANPTNAGNNLNYNWLLNGLPIGINSDTIFNSTLNNGDVISLNITSNANCVSSSNATSNTLTVTVNSVTNILSESLISQTVCLNDTFQALNINAAGSNLTYQWFANSSPSYSGAISISGGTNASYQSASANPGTLYYYCVVNGACGTDTSSISGAQTVNNISQASVSIVASDTNICNGTTVNFTSTLSNGGNNPGYQWTVNGIVIAGANSPSFSSNTLANSDLVNLTLTPGTGACNTTAPITSNGINISVVQTPTINVTNSGPYCEGLSVQLNATSNGIVSWTGPNNFTTTQNNPTVGIASSTLAGVYIATAFTGTCSISDTTLVQVNNNPIATAVSSQTITCINNIITLSGSSNLPSSSFIWTGPGIVSGANTNSCQVNSGGVFILTVTQTTTGCSSNDTIFVASNLTTPSVIADSIKFLACNQSSITIGSFSLDTGIVYQWNPPGTTPNSNNTTVSTPGNYTITVTNTLSGCSVSDVVIVQSTGILPDVDAGIDQILNCTTTVVTLNGSTSNLNTISLWLPAGTDPDSLNNEVSAPGNYILTVTDTISGCSNSDTVLVTYDGSDCGELDFYNALTPNGDGKNDIFYIKNISNYPNNFLIIFNRYGGKIWEGRNYDNNAIVFKGVDMNGIELQPGTYYYLLKYDGKVVKGWLELLK